MFFVCFVVCYHFSLSFRIISLNATHQRKKKKVKNNNCNDDVVCISYPIGEILLKNLEIEWAGLVPFYYYYLWPLCHCV